MACAGVSIVVWVFNWICWYNQCCCCDFLHNPVNKRLVWWTSFIFLLGMLACCISGFVTTNRFGFALEGSWCGMDRIYYDSLNGQLKNTYPKWEGFDSISQNFTNLNKDFYTKVNDINRENLINRLNRSNDPLYAYDGYYTRDYLDSEEKFDIKVNKIMFPIASKYGKIVDSLYNLQQILNNKIEITGLNLDDFLQGLNKIKDDFSGLKEFLNEYYFYARVARGWGKVLTMIYLCLLCIAVTFAGVSMMFYACLKRQGYLQTFMHVLWNVIRFFMFSFFFYGAAYGMCYLALRDAVAFVEFIFGDNLKTDGEFYLFDQKEGVRDFLKFCLINENNDFKNLIDPIIVSSFEDFFKNYNELKVLFEDKESYNNIILKNTKAQEMYIKIKDENFQFVIDNLCGGNKCDNFLEVSKRLGGLFGSLDCSFLKSDLAMVCKTLYDASVEARILCALSCCIGFFGAVFVYFFLLVLHHYNTELFFDNKNSIFVGIGGYGSTKKKNLDPSTKKRRIRNEIELSSRNEEYQPAKNNED